MRKILISLIALSAILILGACGSNKDDESSEQTFSIGEKEIVANDDIVATINGTDIHGGLYNVVYTHTKIQLYNAQQDVNDLDAVKDLVLSTVVDQELLRQEAEKLGIDVSSDEIDNEFTELQGESGKDLDEYLEKHNLQADAFKQHISSVLFLDKYAESEVSISISDEEIEETYNELKEINEEMPELDEIKEQLREEIITLKERDELREIVDKLKEDATIDMKI